MKYDLPPSLSDSARSYSVSVAPNGQQSVAGQPSPAVTFVANSGANLGNFVQNTIAFDIPCGQGLGIMMDPKETLLQFRLTWVVTTAATVTGSICNLVGSAASFFDSLQVVHNNTPLEQIQNYGMLFNQMLNGTVNHSERWGGVSISMGCDTNANSGTDLPVAVGTYYFNFAIPLISIIGLSTDKLIPVGAIQNLQLALMTANVLPVATFCTAVTTSAVWSAPVLDQFSLNMRYIDVGPQAASLLSQTLQDGKWFIKSKSYTNSNANIPVGSSGFQSLLLQIRNSSVNSLFVQYGIGNSELALCPNQNFDSVNLCSVSLQLSIAGLKYPNKALNPTMRPAECFAAYIAAWGGSSLKSFGGVMDRSAYNATLGTLPSNKDNSMTTPSAGKRPHSVSDAGTNHIISYPNMHYNGFDVQRCGGSVLSGVNTRSSCPYLELNLNVPTAYTATAFVWALSDVILVVDVVSKQLQAFI
jgi:hypothetical protein